MWAFQGALESTPRRAFSSLSFPATPQREAHQLMLAPGRRLSYPFTSPLSSYLNPCEGRHREDQVGGTGVRTLSGTMTVCAGADQNGPGEKHLLETKFKIVINVSN